LICSQDLPGSNSLALKIWIFLLSLLILSVFFAAILDIIITDFTMFQETIENLAVSVADQNETNRILYGTCYKFFLSLFFVH